MKKRKFYNYLAEKYSLPYEYIKFKLDRYYIYYASMEVPTEDLEKLENGFNWDSIKADFEIDRNRKESIFYGM